MKKLLMRADDLGYSEGVNYGIAKSVKEGIIKSVGVMTNMPLVVHGLELLKGTEVCFGQHTNICVGKPLTDPYLIPSITNEKGEFKSSKEYREAKEDFVVLDEVILEIEAQYKRFVELVGEPPRYFEGHAVASTNFFKGLEIVAEKYGLKYSGFSIDGTPLKIASKEIYISMDSMKPDYDPYESLKKLVENAEDDKYYMYVCHPGYLDGYILKHSSLTIPRPLEVDMVCDPNIRKWLEESKVELITYDDL
ncbi:ChbG/HpnK family deacetylase [Clostridium sp. SYSU_GA19001]|uniref:ChbG/HpnK family deacetylase n=1 Tax=Clostridium caldaquaticum TaxID=2940653 RepID=UPI002076F2AC|nr:ChbG/HpnK family deacetylase [Clostridium caldaquaticum]MCM8711898.1 ChbG/HpnK family deacetylase [Clostridium caldaquaticum]